MNYKLIAKVLGRALIIESALLVIPLLVSIIYAETTYLSFLIPIGGLLLIGIPLSCINTKGKSIYAKEGFIIVAFCWLLFSLAGATPFVISGEIPNYVDAFFETVSGFTTTGATILDGTTGVTVEAMSRGLMFWRMFTHWIGGMGVLVFIIAIMPGYNEGLMRIYSAESPGPSVDKIVSKIKSSAQILYLIYFVLTAIEVIMLVCGGMPLYDSILNSFSTAGTGGLSLKSASIAGYNSVYVEMVIASFMFLFGINFNFYYFILIGSFSKAFKSEEVRLYFIIVLLSILTIAINLLSLSYNFGEALRYSFFQVTSISSTTGFTSIDYRSWPALSQSILMILSCIGACAGSTAGGIKVARMSILLKSGINDLKKVAGPRYITSVKFEGRAVGTDVIRNVKTYFVLWCGIVVVSTLLLSLFDANFLTNFAATISCFGNVGAVVDMVIGASGCFTIYSTIPKIWLSFVMLAGRLEIFPMLILFMPSIWKRG